MAESYDEGNNELANVSSLGALPGAADATGNPRCVQVMLAVIEGLSPVDVLLAFRNCSPAQLASEKGWKTLQGDMPPDKVAASFRRVSAIDFDAQDRIRRMDLRSTPLFTISAQHHKSSVRVGSSRDLRSTPQIPGKHSTCYPYNT